MNHPTTNKVTLALFQELDRITAHAVFHSMVTYYHSLCSFQQTGIKNLVDRVAVFDRQVSPYTNNQVYSNIFELMNGAVNELPPGQVSNELHSKYRQTQGGQLTSDLGLYRLLDVYGPYLSRDEDHCLNDYGG